MINVNQTNPQYFWYFVGMIASDGNLSKDKRHISLCSKDFESICNIKKIWNLSNIIGLKKNGSKSSLSFYIQFSSTDLYKHLVYLGLTPSKSLSMRNINVPKPFFVDFLRGIIDGDGNIQSWTHQPSGNIQWALKITSGAPIFTKWLQGKIHEYFHVRGKYYTYHYSYAKNPIHILKYGKKEAQLILKKIYYDNCISLKRKLLKAHMCINN